MSSLFLRRFSSVFFVVNIGSGAVRRTDRDMPFRSCFGRFINIDRVFPIATAKRHLRNGCFFSGQTTGTMPEDAGAAARKRPPGRGRRGSSDIGIRPDARKCGIQLIRGFRPPVNRRPSVSRHLPSAPSFRSILNLSAHPPPTTPMPAKGPPHCPS